MNKSQTGSGEVHPLPQRDPWASFALHGMPPETPHPHAEVPPGIPPWADLSAQHGWGGRHRAPRSRMGWRGILAALGISLVAFTGCSTPAPAAPATSPAPSSTAKLWTSPTPKVVQPKDRVIEVVDRIEPAEWKVGQAAEWLDQYTASNMVVVDRCSGKAWKCVTVRTGKLSGDRLGLANGKTVTVDAAKMKRRGYRSASDRKKVLAHELAHTFGLGHSRGRSLMATTLGRVTLTLNKSQRAYLRAR